MTLKEFSKKYQIPYNIVYEASYKVQPISTERRDREYPEKQLFVETRSVVSCRLKKHTEQMRKSNEMMDRLRGVSV